MKSNNIKGIISFIIIISFISGCAVQPRVNRDDESIRKIRNNSMEMIDASIKVNNLLSANDTDDQIAEKTITRLRETLKDPESAKFQNVRVVSYAGGRFACGEINAKNSLGGYVGYKPFIGDFIVNIDKLSEIKRKRSREFYDRAVSAYFSGYNAGCR